MTSRSIPTLLALMTVLAAPALAKAPKPSKPALEQPVTVDSLLTQAHAAVTRGDTDLALRLAQSAIVQDPARPASYVALGDIYADAGQADFARSYYNAALNIDPQSAPALKAISALDDARTSKTANADK